MWSYPLSRTTGCCGEVCARRSIAILVVLRCLFHGKSSAVPFALRRTNELHGPCHRRMCFESWGNRDYSLRRLQNFGNELLYLTLDSLHCFCRWLCFWARSSMRSVREPSSQKIVLGKSIQRVSVSFPFGLLGAPGLYFLSVSKKNGLFCEIMF